MTRHWQDQLQQIAAYVSCEQPCPLLLHVHDSAAANAGAQLIYMLVAVVPGLPENQKLPTFAMGASSAVMCTTCSWRASLGGTDTLPSRSMGMGATLGDASQKGVLGTGH